jgi:tripartite-type tricarboxylate transporter receptor subunit TctC
MDYEQWFGVMGHANLPRPVVDRLAAAMEQVLAMPDVRERRAGMAMEVAAAGPAEMKRKVESDAVQWVRLARELDIKPAD